MDREQALHEFWNGFDVPAYDLNTVPESQREVYPRITYEVKVNSFGIPTSLFASIWDKSTGWTRITDMARKVDSRLSEGGQMVTYDGGALWIKKGNPFLQRMGDPDDTIRRILVNVEIEFLEG